VRTLTIVLMTMLAGACGADPGDGDTLGAAPLDEEARLIVSLRFNDSLLRVYGDETFTLAELDGDVVAERVSRDELGLIAPDVAERWERMVAVGGGGPVIDASLDPWLLEPSDPFSGAASP
jgi:hypothetical protein